MSDTVIKIEDLSKIYRLGEIGTGTLSHDLNRWWRMNILGQEDPYAKVGHVNDRTQKAEKGELVAALRDINLEVKQGEVLGIIGKNGAGKSTLLKLLSRVTSPTTGTIKTKGRLASLLEVGTGFHPEMTGRENIYMNGTIMGMRRWEIAKKLDEIVDFAGVAKYLDTPTKRYSSGMTVRLGFAIAAFLEPEILIVDEVLAVGDAEFQKKAIGKMQDVSKSQGRTVLFVSHNMGAVRNLCGSCILLNNGVLLEKGDTSFIINEYSKLSSNEISNKELMSNGFIIKRVIINAENSNEPIDTLISGNPYSIIIEYEYNAEKIKDLHIGIPISNSYRSFTTVLNNKMSGYSFKNIPSKGLLRCKIDKIPLMYGLFFCTINIVINNNIAISFPDAFQFIVSSGDYYNTGIPNDGKRQGVYINQVWDLLTN